jgi:hypothetical protein
MITHSFNSLDSFDTDYITSKVSGSDAVAARLAGYFSAETGKAADWLPFELSRCPWISGKS